MVDESPMLVRRHIGESLEELRTGAGFTRNDIANHVAKSAETIRRWELGQSSISPSYVEDIAKFCGASNNLAGRLRDLARETRDDGLWEHRNVPPEARILWGAERTAQTVASLELDNVPGLLQVPSYHHAIQLVSDVPADIAETVRQRRTERQERVFNNPKRARLIFVIGRAVIDYMDAWPDVRAEQIARLRETSSLEDVEIWVLPTLHPAMLGSFTVVTPRPGARGGRPFVYLEALDGVRYEERRDVVSLYERTFAAARETAITLEEYLT